MANLKDTHTSFDLFRTVVTQPPEDVSPAGSEAYLVYIYPSSPQIGRRYELGAAAVVGRGSDNAICNPDGSVSRAHARIDRDPDGPFRVTDLGSTNGTFVNHVRTTSAPLRDGDYLRVGNCIYRFLVGGNVEAMYHEEIYRLTVMDPLTGVHNRRSLMEFLDRELARAVRYRRPLTMALLDIDHFKAINDRMSHLAGDLTLKQLAGCMAAQVRKDELLARYGGEEFAVVLPETDAAAGVGFGERLRRAVADYPFTFEGQRYAVTVSVGIGVVSGEDRAGADDLIRRADDKLYEAKRTGRNRVCC